jgi:N6-L-threonylcarbamoyladenine synthase
MLTLGIESSCDETAAALVRSDGSVLSNVVHTQFETHAPYGGVIPELASRDHLTNVRFVVEAALREASVALAQVDVIAATARPGLVGALLVGLQVAKGLAWSMQKPFVGVDHLVGHLLAVFLDNAAPPSFPFVALLVSGGHTALYRVDAPHADAIRALGATRDDAAGEAFDKVAKIVGLGYPGGPKLDKLAATGTLIPGLFTAPKVDGAEFSFSGLKSQAMRRVEQNGVPTEQPLADFCASFQDAVVRALVRKTEAAVKSEGVKHLVVGGGVAANSGLRAALAKLGETTGARVHLPAFKYCTDNASMIAYAGARAFEHSGADPLSVPAQSRTLLHRATRKGRGARSQ